MLLSLMSMKNAEEIPKKFRKDSIFSLLSDDNQSEFNDLEPNFGLCFDIDGVLARGSQPLKEAIKAFKLLSTPDGKLRVPTVFVTNTAACPKGKAKALEEWLNVKVDPTQVIVAPSPLRVFKTWHDKRVLVVGQGDVLGMAKDLGFKKAVLLDDVCTAFPHLDYVDHEKRRLLSDGYKIDENFEKIEAIILLGEPVNWEKYLQVLIDLLVSEGLPETNINLESFDQLPILACNMDLVFMAKAKMPRFGHGAFLACLENLYERITGTTLVYQSIVGKPSEVTFRYAEHMLTFTSKKMGYSKKIQKIYFFGDNPEVDILGANLYNNYLLRYRRLKKITFDTRTTILNSRAIPESVFMEQTAKAMYSILVRTGVYKPESRIEGMARFTLQCHRDFRGAADLVLPSFEVENVLEGIALILRDQNFDISRLCIDE